MSSIFDLRIWIWRKFYWECSNVRIETIQDYGLRDWLLDLEESFLELEWLEYRYDGFLAFREDFRMF